MPFKSDALTQSENDFINEIIVQVPEEHGVRAAFEGILSKLEAQPKLRYVVVDTDRGTVEGTNKVDVAKEFAANEYNFVIDTLTTQWLPNEEDSDTIVEVTQ